MYAGRIKHAAPKTERGNYTFTKKKHCRHARYYKRLCARSSLTTRCDEFHSRRCGARRRLLLYATRNMVHTSQRYTGLLPITLHREIIVYYNII